MAIKKRKIKTKAVEEIIELKRRDATLVEIAYGDRGHRRIVHRKKKDRIALKDVFEKIKDTDSFATPLLPPGTKYYIKKGH